MQVRKKKKISGFTLIELIVVLAILGIVLAISVPAYMHVKTQAEETADQREAELLAEAMKRALADGTIRVDETDNPQKASLMNNSLTNKKGEIRGMKITKTNNPDKDKQSPFEQIFKPIYGTDEIVPDSDGGQLAAYYFRKKKFSDGEPDPKMIEIYIRVPHPTKDNKYIPEVLTAFAYQ